MLISIGAVVLAAGCTSAAGDSTRPSSSTSPLAVLDEPLTADFTYEITYDEEPNASNCPVRSIQFTDDSLGSPEAWAWEFPSGETSAEPSPVVTAAMWGTVTLTVTAGGQSDQVSHDITTIEC